jgi:hypothetical protein
VKCDACKKVEEDELIYDKDTDMLLCSKCFELKKIMDKDSKGGIFE